MIDENATHGLTVAHIAAGIVRARARMATLEAELNEADARLGDGDTGGMLARVIDRMAEQPLDVTKAGDAKAGDGAGGDDLATAFSLLARAAAAATGSSLGTLVATALLTMAKATRGTPELRWADFGPVLGQARDAMLARGGASLGDKTVVDAVDAVAQAVSGIDDPSTLRAAAMAAAGSALAEFRDRPCKVGRARMYAERSIGHDDPGMLAFARLVEALT